MVARTVDVAKDVEGFCFLCLVCMLDKKKETDIKREYYGALQ